MVTLKIEPIRMRLMNKKGATTKRARIFERPLMDGRFLLYYYKYLQ